MSKAKGGLYVRIMQEKIDPEDLLSRVGDASSGSTVLFLGTVRDTSEAGMVDAIVYEAYDKMALKSMEEIAREAVRRWGLCKVAVVHRTGKLALKEASVGVAVSSVHRQEGFAACKFIIDSIKSQVPIWKKERLQGGKERWVEGTTPSLQSKGAKG